MDKGIHVRPNSPYLSISTDTRYPPSDYRGLKKCIGAIRAEQIAKQSSTGTTDVDHVHKHSSDHEGYMSMSILNIIDSLNYIILSASNH